MNQGYQIVGSGDRLSSEELTTMLSDQGQWLLPLVGLIEQVECAVDQVIDVMGRATIEAVLQLSAEQVAGPRRQGKADASRQVQWHGSQGGRRRLFVIDGAKALRAAIDQVCGRHNPVQRCGNHKRRNVISHLPRDQHDKARATLSAAWKLDPEEGMKKIQQYARWLERDWPSASAGRYISRPAIAGLRRSSYPRCFAGSRS